MHFLQIRMFDVEGGKLVEMGQTDGRMVDHRSQQDAFAQGWRAEAGFDEGRVHQAFRDRKTLFRRALTRRTAGLSALTATVVVHLTEETGEPVAHVLLVMAFDVFFGDLAEHTKNRTLQFGTFFRGVKYAPIGFAPPQHIGQRTRAIEHLLERFRSSTADQIIGIFALG